MLAEYYPNRYYELMAKKKPMSLEDRLRAAVKKDGRTQYAIAKAAGITPIMLTRFIHGERSVSVPTFEKIARVVGLNLGE